MDKQAASTKGIHPSTYYISSSIIADHQREKHKEKFWYLGQSIIMFSYEISLHQDDSLQELAFIKSFFIRVLNFMEHIMLQLQPKSHLVCSSKKVLNIVSHKDY